MENKMPLFGKINCRNLWKIVYHSHLDTQALILDDGIGIFEKIRSHFRMKSLDEAIQELFKGKLTTDE
jgi:hypothetical protein